MYFDLPRRTLPCSLRGLYNVLTVDILQRSVSEDGPYNFLAVDALRRAAWSTDLLKKIYEIASKRKASEYSDSSYIMMCPITAVVHCFQADQKTT